MKTLRGQQLALAAKGGGGRRGDSHSQRGVIAASEVAEASWIWTTRCMQLRATASRRIGLPFGCRDRYCSNRNITRRQKINDDIK